MSTEVAALVSMVRARLDPEASAQPLSPDEWKILRRAIASTPAPSWEVVVAGQVVGCWGLARARREAARRPGSTLRPSSTVIYLDLGPRAPKE